MWSTRKRLPRLPTRYWPRFWLCFVTYEVGWQIVHHTVGANAVTALSYIAAWALLSVFVILPWLGRSKK